ncbi:Dienelactone hydrolase [Pseudomonas syringae pv. antirrhini]|uniref:Dienelactone hydrolase n=1 Tax=Pseudomonas syringae pv. antirrhini TaxID=251702 RepID=A0A0P9LQ79_9PSED|nr:MULTISPECIES: alpha/beta hydrolase [Pseudomonas]KPW46477.1 Dienelactone hydrolase [Pseudomonas syringae pv. antirrhini]RMW24760.1 Dienelactone hydrolase [Pseudomonas syringae pv. antirrhini]WIN08024.1 alpha/beta hydrolase [Pseudomonas syringae pv. antirrhini str. 126]
MRKIVLMLALLASSFTAMGQDMSHGADNFYKSDKVTVEKVTFKNQYQMDIVANLFVPKGLDRSKKYPAVIVGHPNGAVKEQSANLYAQKLAEQGFVTLAPDLSFWGESSGTRNAVSSDIYTEVFMASTDFMGTRSFIDRNRIGILGICGSGGYAISAAKIDPRLKAIATVSMYDMGSVTRNGLNHSQSIEQRKQFIAAAAEQRYVEFLGGKKKYSDGMLETLRPDAGAIEREFFDFYRTKRGAYVPKGSSLYLTTNRPITAEVKQMNFYPFNDIETISPRPMLFITGSEAHSREFSEAAYKLAGQPKELVVIPNAGHVDLYDRTDLIPFAKLTDFFQKNLK